MDAAVPSRPRTPRHTFGISSNIAHVVPKSVMSAKVANHMANTHKALHTEKNSRSKFAC